VLLGWGASLKIIKLGEPVWVVGLGLAVERMCREGRCIRSGKSFVSRTKLGWVDTRPAEFPYYSMRWINELIGKGK
jgi:hypothetical protein